jgi:acetolactate synthase-1/2/3 large subunit
LKQVGVKHVFGYSGGANLPILDAFHDSTIEFIMNRSEQCCGHAAEGYAKVRFQIPFNVDVCNYIVACRQQEMWA